MLLTVSVDAFIFFGNFLMISYIYFDIIGLYSLCMCMCVGMARVYTEGIEPVGHDGQKALDLYRRAITYTYSRNDQADIYDSTLHYSIPIIKGLSSFLITTYCYGSSLPNVPAYLTLPLSLSLSISRNGSSL